MSPSRPELYKPDGQINWDALKIDYLSRCTPEEAEVMRMSTAEIMARRGWKRPGEGEGHSASKSTTAIPDEGPKPEFSSSVPIDQRIEIVVKYGDGLTVKQLAEKFKRNPITVRRILVAAGAYDPNRDKGKANGSTVNGRKVMRGDS